MCEKYRTLSAYLGFVCEMASETLRAQRTKKVPISNEDFIIGLRRHQIPPQTKLSVFAKVRYEP
jgi:hypothetical protein